MNTRAIAKALRDLADAIDEPGAGGSAPRPIAPASLPPDFDELPPDDGYAPVTQAVTAQVQRGQQIAQQDAALGVCPVHGTAWTVKAGGVSAAGKPYNAFYKCSGKMPDDTYCKQKPTKVWADTHPIRDAA